MTLWQVLFLVGAAAIGYALVSRLFDRAAKRDRKIQPAPPPVPDPSSADQSFQSAWDEMNRR